METLHNIDQSNAPRHAKSDDPRAYIESGRRLAVRKSVYMDDWFVGHSPRNDNEYDEGTWEEWLDLAHKIIQADKEWKRGVSHGEQSDMTAL